MTRLRRRISDGTISKDEVNLSFVGRISDGTISKDEVNLSFVENEQEGSVYRFIDLEGPAEIAEIKMMDYN